MLDRLYDDAAQHWCGTGGRYLSPLSMMSGVQSPPTVCIEKHILKEVNSLIKWIAIP